jgi:hypothetical protein
MNSTLYDQDYYLWIQQTLQVLQRGEFSELDTKNLSEEIEDMGISQKNALESNLIILLIHLLKWKYRRRILKSFKDSPSLKRYFAEIFEECYQEARQQASDETGLSLDTFPLQYPFTQELILTPDYLSD